MWKRAQVLAAPRLIDFVFGRFQMVPVSPVSTKKAMNGNARIL
jgi:hypothetical protein